MRHVGFPVYNPRSMINAFITVTGDSALADSQHAEKEILNGQSRGPLHGFLSL